MTVEKVKKQYWERRGSRAWEESTIAGDQRCVTLQKTSVIAPDPATQFGSSQRLCVLMLYWFVEISELCVVCQFVMFSIDLLGADVSLASLALGLVAYRHGVVWARTVLLPAQLPVIIDFLNWRSLFMTTWIHLISHKSTRLIWLARCDFTFSVVRIRGNIQGSVGYLVSYKESGVRPNTRLEERVCGTVPDSQLLSRESLMKHITWGQWKGQATSLK